MADVLIVGLIALLFLNPRRRPLATREGSVSGPNGYTFSLLLPMALAAIMPAIILYFVFDSLPATVQTFLRSQVVNLSVAALA
ncbi:MAG: hypothetical protein JF615_01645, partial [Asticcacaulis sp.]|nr:hypothetical protein [Asticcacaulis sp.]